MMKRWKKKMKDIVRFELMGKSTGIRRSSLWPDGYEVWTNNRAWAIITSSWEEASAWLDSRIQEIKKIFQADH